MAERPVMNNRVMIAGTIISEAKWSHEVFGEKFYLLELKVNRLSGRCDMIPLMISDRLINMAQLQIGKYVQVNGQLRTFNRHEDEKSHLLLSLFAKEITIYPEEQEMQPNWVCIEGYICRPSSYRKTPKGREVTDLLLAVNRSYNKSDYIPCICWGRNARYVDTLPIGSHLRVWGRLQSRVYRKKVGENEVEDRVTYELSVNKMEYYDDIYGSAEKVAES